MGTRLPTRQRWCRGSANVTQLGGDTAETRCCPPAGHCTESIPCTSPLSPWHRFIEPAAKSRLARIQVDSGWQVRSGVLVWSRCCCRSICCRRGLLQALWTAPPTPAREVTAPPPKGPSPQGPLPLHPRLSPVTPSSLLPSPILAQSLLLFLRH